MVLLLVALPVSLPCWVLYAWVVAGVHPRDQLARAADVADAIWRELKEPFRPLRPRR